MNLRRHLTHVVLMTIVVVCSTALLCRIAGLHAFGDHCTALAITLELFAMSSLAGLPGGWSALHGLDAEAVRRIA